MAILADALTKIGRGDDRPRDNDADGRPSGAHGRSPAQALAATTYQRVENVAI
ncbi:hypothetical protein [Methylocystis suflitae]|uniref:hypothetical protein n=1 Tax=Methylocystis suflitae TaxID=2951405 RepID=UPI00210D3E76|nr:hypothetical protein [Methylocystis suflitae]MCQ4190786.1 hypothetical protein [Methylocystis suflitae]